MVDILHVSISLENMEMSTFNTACVNTKTMPQNWYRIKSNI